MNEFERLLELVERGRDIFYHLTPDDYGPVVEFYPRRPYTALLGEPDDPRICVSPSLAGCIVAGSFSLLPHMNEKLYVYATKAKAQPVDSGEVFDADVTEEHWIMEPAVFVLVGEIDVSKDISPEVNDYMIKVPMPYERYDEEDEEYEGEGTPYMNHMAAKEEAESDVRHIEESIHRTAREKLSAIIPRIKDMPGQGLFYFADEVRKEEEEPVLAEADESGGVEIPKVKAPGNFHQVINRRGEDDEK